MLVLFFSGTGNSKFIAKKFASKMRAECLSIEEKVDFGKMLDTVDTVAVVYPIYGSSVPRIMREFAARHLSRLKDKKLIIFCTQMMFSGDGARAFARLIPDCEDRILYAEHFNLPNNICNIPLFAITKWETAIKPKRALKRLDKACDNIKKGIVKKRGWSKFSTILGKIQNVGYPKLEERARHSFYADETCIKCGVCVRLCPMDNLDIVDGKVVQKENCIACYRCVNACPKQSAMVFIKTKPKKQYKGIENQLQLGANKRI